MLLQVACSAGSACHSSKDGESDVISEVLQAMKVPNEYAIGTLRLSFGRHTTESDIDKAVLAIGETLKS